MLAKVAENQVGLPLMFRFLFCIIIFTCLTNCRNTSQDELNNLQFEDFDTATKIEVRQYENSASPTIITEEDPAKIQFAREFIKNHPNGWKRPPFTAVIGASTAIVFFNEGEYLGEYGVGDDYLTYNQKYAIRLTNDDEIDILFEKLGISEE